MGFFTFRERGRKFDQIILLEAPQGFVPDDRFDPVARTIYNSLYFDSNQELQYFDPGQVPDFKGYLPSISRACWATLTPDDGLQPNRTYIHYNQLWQIYAVQQSWGQDGQKMSKIYLVGLESKVSKFLSSQKP